MKHIWATAQLLWVLATILHICGESVFSLLFFFAVLLTIVGILSFLAGD